MIEELLELLKNYGMGVLYHSHMANVVIDALSMFSLVSVAHIEEGKKELAKEAHRLGH